MRFGVLGSLVPLLLVLGCKGSKLPELYPLHGQVVRAGQPVTGGYLTFRSGVSNLIVTAAVGPDGKFEAFSIDTTTRGAKKQKGAPAGTYQVTYHPPSTNQNAVAEEHLQQTVLVVAADNEVTVDLMLPGTKK